MELVYFRKFSKETVVKIGKRKPHREGSISLKSSGELCSTHLTIVC